MWGGLDENTNGKRQKRKDGYSEGDSRMTIVIIKLYEDFLFLWNTFLHLWCYYCLGVFLHKTRLLIMMSRVPASFGCLWLLLEFPGGTVSRCLPLSIIRVNHWSDELDLWHAHTHGDVPCDRIWLLPSWKHRIQTYPDDYVNNLCVFFRGGKQSNVTTSPLYTGNEHAFLCPGYIWIFFSWIVFILCILW